MATAVAITLSPELLSLQAKARVCELGQGLPFAAAFGQPHAPTTSVFAIATARAAFEATMERCKTEVRDGKPLIDHQPVAMRLADMYADIELARAVTWKAAWSGEHNPDHDLKFGMVSQLASAEMAVRVCKNAMELWGRAGAVGVARSRSCFATPSRITTSMGRTTSTGSGLPARSAARPAAGISARCGYCVIGRRVGRRLPAL